MFDRQHPIQRARTQIFNIFYEKSKSEYYYSGVLKYFSVTGEVFQMFHTINNNDYHSHIGNQLFIRSATMSNSLSLNQPQQIPTGVTVSVSSLLQGKRYAWISHAGETYLLQLTKSNKLPLTK